MRIRLSARGMAVGAALRDYTQRRVHFALSRFDGQIRQVDVRLSIRQAAGRGSRPERCCRIAVDVHRIAAAVVEEDTQADLRLAIDRAVDRVARTVARRLEHARDSGSAGLPSRV